MTDHYDEREELSELERKLDRIETDYERMARSIRRHVFLSLCLGWFTIGLMVGLGLGMVVL